MSWACVLEYLLSAFDTQNDYMYLKRALARLRLFFTSALKCERRPVVRHAHSEQRFISYMQCKVAQPAAHSQDKTVVRD